MTVIIPPQQVIPAASLTAGHMTFVPVPAHLKPWLHSVWQSEYATHTALSTERCYPDGGHSLTFSVDDACYDATVLFGTKTGNLSKFNRPSAVSFRFHPGAFSECFGIKAESVPQNTDIPLSALFQEPLPRQRRYVDSHYLRFTLYLQTGLLCKFTGTATTRSSVLN